MRPRVGWGEKKKRRKEAQTCVFGVGRGKAKSGRLGFQEGHRREERDEENGLTKKRKRNR